ncbi:hypothetical protein [Halosolutus gelatinilyticus]|uniref:hypothetical protein n=1 Tax=Halosolutus gelatinilyticus TaxID=2931975 RepID=UPI001FF3FE83|nr:hypothetical protein [Halosolutus gelatinilyticus]
MYSRSRGILYTAPPTSDDADADDVENGVSAESRETTPTAVGSSETAESPADD